MRVRTKFLLASAVAEMFAVGSAAHGATIAQYTFPSLSPTVPNLAATTVDPNATASDVTLGASVNPPVSTNDFWISKPVVSFSRANDTALAVYFQATITAAAGYELNLDSFTFDGARGGAATPRTYEVHSSVGGLARDADILPSPPTSITSGTFDIQRGPNGATDPLPTTTADLTSPAYDHLTSLTMRVYFYTPTTNQNIDIDNLSFNGIVALPGSVTTSTWTSPNAGNWNTSSNWSAGVPNGVDAEADFLSAITGTRTVFSDTPLTLGTMGFNNTSTYHVTGGGSLTMQSSTSSLIQVQAGVQKINLPLVIASNTTLDVATGATLKISDPVTINAGKSLTQTPGGGNVTYESTVTMLSGSNLLLASSSHLARLDVGPTAISTIAPSGGLTTIKLDSLVMDSTARLDLKDNKVIVTGGNTGSWNGSSYTGITGQIQSGRNGSTLPLWDGNGLITSQTQATGGNFTSIGVARASDVRSVTSTATTTWGGQTITGIDTLVMYTYGGDANLDGKLNIDDYVRIDSGIAAGLTGWANGDFNYDGKVNIDDYTTVIDANIGNQNGFVFPTAGGIDGESASHGVSAVPEPASIGIVFGASVLLMRRRRRPQVSASHTRGEPCHNLARSRPGTAAAPPRPS
jgi:hypothetical protein